MESSRGKTIKIIENFQSRATKKFLNRRDRVIQRERETQSTRHANSFLPTKERRREDTTTISQQHFFKGTRALEPDDIRKKFLIQKSNGKPRNNFFTERILITWDELPEEVIESENVNSIIVILDKFWKNKTFKFDLEKSNVR